VAKIFGKHLLILKELKIKIDLLKQAYFGQMDKRKSWDRVDEILDVLKSSCHYLDFPDEDISDFFVEAGKP